MEDKILESLLESNRKMSEISNLRDDFKEQRHKVEKHSEEIAVLKSYTEGLWSALETEKKLNRDRQLDFSKLLDDKINTIFKIAFIVASVVSFIISFLLEFI